MKGWGAYIVIALAYFGYSAMTSADRDDSGAIIDGGSVGAFDVRVGDCFDDPTSMNDEITSLPAVPCTEPHDNEIYATVNVDMPEYPGEDAMWEHANERCLAQFAGFVGRDYETSELDIYTMYPTKQSWAQDDREVVCALYRMDTEKMTGSAEGTAI